MIDPKKAAGPDGLDPFFLKTSAPIIAKLITDIFNLSVSTRKFPDLWKQAYVTPLLKPGNPTKLNNYRPISDLSAMAKIMQSLASDQLKLFLESHNILNPMHSGFRAKHSTVTATP